MKKIFAIIMGLLLVISITACKVDSKEQKVEKEKEEVVLNIGAIKDYKQSKEGHTLVFDSLNRIDSLYNPLPGIINKWEVNEDKTQYDLFYPTNIKFHDGKNLDAETLKYDIEDGGKLNYCAYSYVLDKVEVVEEGHLRVHLKAPYLYLMQDLAKVTAVPKGTWDETGANKTFVGTGPFKYEETTSGDVTVLKRNEEYWNKDYKTDVKIINWHHISDEQTRKLALESGKIDVLGLSEHYISLPYSAINQLKQNDKYEIIKEDDENYTSVGSINFNWKNDKMSNVELRRAISHLFNREELVKNIFFGIPKPCAYHYNPKFLDGPSKDMEFTFDEEKAKSLFKKAGYTLGDENTPATDPNGKPAVFSLMVSDDEYQKDLSVYLQAVAKKYGIEININTLEGSTRVEAFKKGEYDMVISHPWFVPLIDSLGFMGMTDEYSDYGLGYGINQDMKDAGNAFIQASSKEQAEKLSKKIWEIQYSQAVSAPLFADIRYIVHNKKFEGFHFDPYVTQIDLNGVVQK